jgi:hypothetical protein
MVDKKETFIFVLHAGDMQIVSFAEICLITFLNNVKASLMIACNLFFSFMDAMEMQ